MSDQQRGHADPRSDEYTVRSYDAADRDQFLSLYEDVWGHERSPEWFEWRFERNPYYGDVRMTVAEQDGALIGAEPLLPLRMLVDEPVLSFQPVDWMVHPDHRRRGVFSRMTEHLLSSTAGETEFLFNFPNDALLPGLKKFDWSVVSTRPSYYRVQQPSALLDLAATAGRVPATVGSLSRPVDPLVNGYLRVRDRLASGSSDVSVERRSTIPTATLADIYRDSPPDQIHTVRDEEFYDWRFDNPRWETTTYVARQDGSPVGSLVVVTESKDDVRCAYLADAQPMGDRPGRTDAFEALVEAVVTNHRDADILKVAGTVVPPSILRRWGFRGGDRFPHSMLAVPTIHAARSLSADGSPGSRFERHDITSPDDWLLSLADQDIE